MLIYAGMSLTGTVISPGADYEQLFSTITGSPLISITGLGLFLAIAILIVSFGIKDGIERANKIMMPLLFIFFIVLVIRSVTFTGAAEGLAFFLKPDFSKITAEGILYALGQSFFALAVGISVMVTYSSYLGKEVSLPFSAISVSIMNIFVSLLAGLAIFLLSFHSDWNLRKGPGCCSWCFRQHSPKCRWVRYFSVYSCCYSCSLSLRQHSVWWKS